METLLLDDALYVQERYEELEAEKKRQSGHVHHHHGDARWSRRDPPKANRDTWPSESATEADNGLARVRELDATWPITLQEKKLAVMEASLLELTAFTRRAFEEAEKNAEGENETRTAALTESPKAAKPHDPALPADETTPKHLQDLPMSSQLSLNMFFRLCASLRSAGNVNGRLLGMIASKIPAMLESLPPLALSPGILDAVQESDSTEEAACSAPTLSVFQELLHLYGDYLQVDDLNENTKTVNVPNGGVSQVDKANAVMAYVALSLKWGRLRDLVQAMLLLTQHPDILSAQHISQLRKLLSELANAQAEIPSQPLLPQDFSPVGILVSFGKGDHGKLGHGQCTHVSCSEGNCTENKNVPTVIASTRDVKFVKIDSLSTHSIAITTKGEVMAWGNGDKYRLGHGTTSKEYAPRIIDSLSLKGTVTDVACGLGHTIALMSGGAIYAWGNGSNGRLGLGDTNDRSSPTKVPIPAEGALRSSSSPFRYVMCGASHSLALTSDGLVFTWGKNNQGQCGHGHTNDQLVVAEVKHFREELGERVTHASGGWEHTLFCSASGRVYSCGCGYKDSRRTGIPPVLGHGDCEKRLKPSVIQSLVDANEEIARVSCGWDHSLAVSAEGGLYTWGSGTNGKLGHGDEENCEVPTLVRSLNGKLIKDAKAGCEHTVAITNEHEVWTFGQGDSGRLGLGDTITRKSPTLVEFFGHSGLRPVAIAVGDKYNLVLAEDAGTSSRQPNGVSPAKSMSPSKFRLGHQRQYGAVASANRSRRHHSVVEALKRMANLGFPLKNEANFVFNTKITAEEGLDNQAAIVTFIASHVARISGEYLQKMGEGDLYRAQTPQKSPMLLPFGVDASLVTVQRLLELISCVRGHDLQNASTSDRIEKAIITVDCLRLLTVNVSYWPESLPSSRRSDEGDVVFDRVHEVATAFATNGVGHLSTNDQTGDTQSEQVQQLDTAIREEAALILKVGFTRFFPTREARANLLWGLISSADVRATHIPVHTEALAGKLCEDSVMGEIVCKYFERSASHECAHTSDSDDHEANGATLFLQNTRTALEACFSESTERLEGDHPVQKQGIAILLQLLGVLQGHIFAVANCCSRSSDIEQERPDIGGDAWWSRPACECAFEWLLTYLGDLFDGSLAALKSLRKTISDTGRADQASCGILDKVLLPAIQAVCAIVAPVHKQGEGDSTMNRENTLRCVERILPRVKSMLVVVDEVVWRTQSQGHELIAAPGWIFELGEACAMLCGHLSSQLMRTNVGENRVYDTESAVRVLLGGPHEIALIRSHQTSTATASILKWDDSSERQMSVDMSTSDGAGDEDSVFLRKCLEDESLRESMLTNIERCREGKKTSTNTRFESDPSLRQLRDCGFILIAWFGGFATELRDSKISENSALLSSRWTAQALTMFEADISTVNDTSHYKGSVSERTKQLLGFKSLQFQRLSSASSLQQWISALRDCLIGAASYGDLEDAVLEYIARPTLIQIGLTIYTDALHKVSSPSLKSHLLRQLFSATASLTSQRSFPSLVSANFASTVESLGLQLANAVAMKDMNAVGKAKALGVWLWILRNGSVSSSKLSELIASTGLILQIAELLTQNSSRQNEHLQQQPTVCTELALIKDKRQSQQWAQRLMPMEALLVAGKETRNLTAVAFEVLSAVAEHLCGNAITVDDIHPLLLAPSTSVTGSKSTALQRPGSSPRRSQTLPKKLAILTVSESTKIVFDCVAESVRRDVSKYEATLDVVSPLTQADRSKKRHTRPAAALLLASPISISKSRSHIGKTLRTPRTAQKVKPLPVRAVSFWMFLDQPQSPSASGTISGSSTLVNLVTLGSMTDRLQESAVAVGSNQAIEVEATDQICLTMFALASETSGEYSVGYGIDVAGGDAPHPLWLTFLSMEPVCSHQWVHAAVSVNGTHSVLYINGKAAACRPLPTHSSPLSVVLPSEFSLGQLNARMQIVCGGSLGETFQDLLGIPTLHQNQPPIPALHDPTTAVNLLVDDVWLYTTAIDVHSAHALYEQGPTFLQAKREFEAEENLLRSLRLLDKMLSVMPLSRTPFPAATESEPGPISGLVELLLRVIRQCRSVNTYEIALFAAEVLKKLLPCPHFPEPTRGTFASVIECVKTDRSNSCDLRTQLSKLYAFGARAGIQSGSVVASQAAMATLFIQQGITKVGSSGEGGGAHHQSFRAREVVDVSLVQLLQTLSSTAAWRPLFLQLMNESATSLQNVSEVVEGGTFPTSVAVTMSAGYSELFMNDLKLSLLQSKPTLKSVMWMNLDTAWSSIRGVWPGAESKWSTLSCQFALSLLDDSLRLPHLQDAVSLNEVTQARAADFQLVKVSELQTKVLRCMAFEAAAIGIIDREWHTGLLSNVAATETLLNLCALPVKELLRHRLGLDAKQAYRLHSVRSLMDSLLGRKARSHGRQTLYVQDEIEALVGELLARLEHQQRYLEEGITDIEQTSSWRLGRPRVSPLEPLGGEVIIQGLTVQAVQHFPTVRLGRVVITANSGLWYYEVQVLTDGLMQIGYVDSEFVADAIQGQGVGDQPNSWAFDGYRCKKWNVNPVEYGEAWQAGDVVGVLLDTDRMELSYFLNRKFLGIAFTGLPLTLMAIMHPAVSLNADQRVRFNFGRRNDDPKAIGSDGYAQEPLRLPSLQSPLDQKRLQAVVYAMEELPEAVEEIESPTISEIDEMESCDDGDEDLLQDNCGASDDDDDPKDEDVDCQEELLPRKLAEESVSIYHRSGLYQSRQLAGSLQSMDTEPFSIGSIVDASNIHPNPRVGRQDSRRDGSQDGDQDDEHADNGSREVELVDGLVNLGFPRSWAVRCAQETVFSANDSGAVSWILEQMEKDATASAMRSFSDVARFTNGGFEQTDFELSSAQEPRRAQDDLSLMASASSASGAHRLLHLSLSPTRDGRPHTEQQTRSRDLILSPERPRPANASSRRDQPLNVNPFLSAELQDDDDDDNDVEEVDSLQLLSTGSQQSYSLAVEKPLRRECVGLGGDDSANKSKEEPTQCGNNRSSTTDEEDLAPACVVAQSILSLCYCRLIAQFTLFGDASDASIVYPIVVKWIDLGRSGLCQFLRIQLQLSVSELPATLNRSGTATQGTSLSKGLVKLLTYEASRLLVSGSNELPLLQTLLKEVRSQTTKAARYVTRFRMRRSGRHDESASKIMALAMDARWTLWLLTVVQRSISSSTSSPHSTTALDAVAEFISPPFVDDLTKLAASSSGVYLPWQAAAFNLIKISMAIRTRAVNDDSVVGSHGVVPLEYLIERLDQTLGKELSCATSLSVASRTLWEIALSHLPPPRSAELSSPARTTSMQLHVEQLASTYATISWKCPETLPAGEKAAVEGEDDQADLVSTIENAALSLEVIPTADRLAQTGPAPSSNWLPRGLLHPGVPHLLPSSGALVVRHLVPDSSYTIRLVKSTTDGSSSHNEVHDATVSNAPVDIEVCETQIQTPPQQVFELSNDACGKNLVLSNRNRTVKNLVNKKWHTVRASVAFDEGVHHWHVRIDACVSKNIFIGICTSDASLENYIGSDAYGYGFLANKAVWHNKSKLQSYGEIFKQGDLIQVALDCNARTLSYSRNGEFLGVAATNLRVGGSSSDTGTSGATGTGQAGHKWYPAVSLYNKDDQLTIIVPPSSLSSTAISSRQRPQFASVLELVDSARLALSFSRLIQPQYPTPADADKALVVSDCFALWHKWKQAELCWREVALCDVIQIDVSRDPAVDVFGLGPEDSIFTSRGHCIVLGVAKHELWYEVSEGLDNNGGGGRLLSIGSWSLRTCREMLRSPDDYPVHRSRHQRIAPGGLSKDEEDTNGGEGDELSASLSSLHPVAASEAIKHEFLEAQHSLTTEKMDMALMSLVDAIAWHRGLSSPHQLTFADFSSAFVLHDVVDVFKTMMVASPDSRVLQQEDLLMRAAVLLDLNQHVYRVIRLFLVPDCGSSLWEHCLSVALDPSDRSSPVDSARTRVSTAARLAASIGVSSDEISLPITLHLHSEMVVRRQEVVRFLCARLFTTQREKIITDALRRTATPTMSPSLSDSKSSDLGGSDDTAQGEPKEMIRIQIQAPSATVHATSFWQQELLSSRVWLVPAPGERRAATRFAQLSKQLASVAPHELRREFIASTESAGISRTFHIVQAELSEASQSAVSPETPADQSLQYLKLLDDVFTEIQSPAFPLFVPESSPPPASAAADWDVSSVYVQLDVNAHLLLPEFAARNQIRAEEALLWFFHVGQLLGVVWRSRCLVPLQFISLGFWERLLHEDCDANVSPSGANATLHTGRVMATRAVRDGLCSVVPPECLQLSTPESLRCRLSDRDVLAIEKLHHHAIFHRDASHHGFFWSVVRSFSSLERRILMQFLRGKPSSVARSVDDSSEDPIESWKHRVLSTEPPANDDQLILELAEPLPDALTHPDACFPVVDVVQPHVSRLHLPEYSSGSVLRHKLLFAMHNQLPS